ncbi:MAG: PASTA domain-containing protein [Ruminococcus sp.]|nr:PASTA domain-containing protein [Ruminococcus sp.]
MDNKVKLCMGCMNELDENGECHYCTYTDDIPYLQSYLAPHTVLCDRYIVGKMLSYNGEGASYICFDMITKTKAVIREYMPDTLCEREMKSKNLVVNPDCLAKYKTYMSEFQDLNRTLTRMRNLGSICTAMDMFNENNTCYVVLEYGEGVSLKKFLQANRGYLQWNQVKKLFMPLFTTLSILHNAGIIHRGISPENIIVTTEGKLKLTGFSISSIRTANTALSPEFYSGYTAPEQYSSLEWQGTWTDVYSIAAVIYRILTGYVPPDANNRQNNDTMIPASRINPHIPRHISNVLLHAMAVRGTDRIKSINDLVSELFENVSQPSPHVKGATQTIPVVNSQVHSQAPERRNNEQKKPAKKKGNGAVTVLGLLILALLLVLGIFMLYEVFQPQDDDDSDSDSSLVSVVAADDDDSEILIQEATSEDNTESTEESPYGTGAIMPNVVGLRLDTVERELGDYFTIRTDTYYSDTDDQGIIYEQSIPEGMSYDPSLMNELTLKVCLGPSEVVVPEYSGQSKKTYLNTLSDLGIKYSTQESTSSSVAAGYVIRTSVDPGSYINVEDGETLVVYVSSGPPVTSSASSSSSSESSGSSSASSEAEDDEDSTSTEIDSDASTDTEADSTDTLETE